MKKYILLSILAVAVCSISYGQKATKTVESYVVLQDINTPVPTETLDSMEQYQNDKRYLRINVKLIVKEEMRNSDTEIWYFLLSRADQKTYISKISKRKRDRYFKSHGVIYVVKRTTPVLSK